MQMSPLVDEGTTFAPASFEETLEPGEFGEAASWDGCGSFTTTLRKGTWPLNKTAFRYQQTRRFCWTYRGTVSRGSTSTRFIDVNSAFLIDKNYCGTGVLSCNEGYWVTEGISRYVFSQAHISNCVSRYGCFGEYYPWVESWTHGGSPAGISSNKGF